MKLNSAEQLAQHIADVRERALVLKSQHVAATTKMLRYAPAPGAQPTRRARREFARYAAETVAVLAELKAAEEQMTAIAELIEAHQGDTKWQ